MKNSTIWAVPGDQDRGEPCMDTNDTDEGREANRRIEFKLLRRDAEQVDLETTLESMAEDSETSETEESADD